MLLRAQFYSINKIGKITTNHIVVYYVINPAPVYYLNRLYEKNTLVLSELAALEKSSKRLHTFCYIIVGRLLSGVGEPQISGAQGTATII